MGSWPGPPRAWPDRRGCPGPVRAQPGAYLPADPCLPCAL